MISRERMRRALTFDYPDRIPRDLWVLPIASNKYEKKINAILEKFPLDLQWAWPEPRPELDPSLKKHFKGDRYKIGTFVDEWGCTFQNIHGGIIGEVKDPLIKILSDVSKVKLPYEFKKDKMARVEESWKKSDKFILGGSFLIDPFERMQWLRGTPQLYMDIIDQTPQFFELRDKVHQYFLKELELWTKTDVDGIMFADDWGSQKSLLISPTLWRKLLKPLYKDYCVLIHNAGKFVFMHSDGYIFDIYEDLIEIGIDAINSQLFCMDIEEIGRRFKGRITFYGEIDRQRVLASENLDDVRKAVKRVKESLYDCHGGVVAQCEFGTGAKPENVEAVFKEWENIED